LPPIRPLGSRYAGALGLATASFFTRISAKSDALLEVTVKLTLKEVPALPLLKRGLQ
jgi:hypothetical protein